MLHYYLFCTVSSAVFLSLGPSLARNKLILVVMELISPPLSLFQDCVSAERCHRLQGAGGSGRSVCKGLHSPGLQSSLHQGLHLCGKCVL